MTRKQFEALVLNRFNGNDSMRIVRTMSNDTHSNERHINICDVSREYNNQLSFLYNKDKVIARIPVCDQVRNINISLTKDVRRFDEDTVDMVFTLLESFYFYKEIKELREKYISKLNNCLLDWYPIFYKQPYWEEYDELRTMLHLAQDPEREKKVFKTFCKNVKANIPVSIYYSDLEGFEIHAKRSEIKTIKSSLPPNSRTLL